MKTHTYSEYVQNKHFAINQSDIMQRLDVLKNDLVENLEDFVENIRTKYIKELSDNAAAKKVELDAIMDAKATAEQTIIIINNLSDTAKSISENQKTADKIKGGISNYVQLSNQT